MKYFYLVIGFVFSYFITVYLGNILIPYLHRLKFGQTIKEIGPTWHKSKQGTPTMGGLMFITGMLIAASVGYLTLFFNMQYRLYNDVALDGMKFFSGIFMATGFGAIGFIDDYIKVVKKRNLGLLARQKTILQILIGVLYLFSMYFVDQSATTVIVPFIGQFNIGFLYYPLALFIIVGTVNAVNLTDGIDGLASSVTAIVGASFFTIAYLFGLYSMQLMAICLIGGCVGFLKWNSYPAKVFMGDTGSMFLGGMVVALAFGIGQPIILLFIGIIYIIETMSVILQIINYKLTGKRIFKMSPIHHHFEMSGYSENKIVLLFSAITFIGCVLAIISVKI